mmetsp:Transcript_5631/g.11951  ORF Transcript_5631/g.11951 Transcript_5631/m.11951 type:complete len:82 (+) Transcript_5631:120-365(+)
MPNGASCYFHNGETIASHGAFPTAKGNGWVLPLQRLSMPCPVRPSLAKKRFRFRRHAWFGKRFEEFERDCRCAAGEVVEFL